GAVVGEAGGGPEAEQLIGRHGAVVDVAAGQAEDRLEILGGVDVPVDDRLRHVRRVAGQLGDDAVGDRLLEGRPGPGLEMPRAVLHEAGHDVPAGGGDRRVEDRVDAGLDGRVGRERPAPAVVPRILDEVDGRAEV